MPSARRRSPPSTRAEADRFARFLASLRDAGTSESVVRQYQAEWDEMAGEMAGEAPAPDRGRFRLDRYRAEEYVAWRRRRIAAGASPAAVNRRLVFLRAYAARTSAEEPRLRTLALALAEIPLRAPTRRRAAARPASEASGTAGSVLRWDGLPARDVGGGILRQLFRGRLLEAIRYVYPPGAVFPVHAHPEEQMTFVLRGRIEVRVGGRTEEAGPGSFVVVPGGAPHGVSAVGRRPAHTINVFTPPRAALPDAR